MNQSKRGNVLRSLFMAWYLTRCGLVNAVTDASKLTVTYERATEMERIGGEILMAPVDKRAIESPGIWPMKNVTPEVPVLAFAEK